MDLPRTTDPRHAGRADIAAWRLRAAPACLLARAGLDGSRFPTASAFPLPTLGCGSRDCGCHWEAAPERRVLARDGC